MNVSASLPFVFTANIVINGNCSFLQQKVLMLLSDIFRFGEVTCGIIRKLSLFGKKNILALLLETTSTTSEQC
jgi:hypothetical protein